MKKLSFRFTHGETACYLGESFSRLGDYADPAHSVVVLDHTVKRIHGSLLEGWKTIQLPEGEDHKDLESLCRIIEELIRLGVDRRTLLIGVGGGVVTDTAGFAAAIYLRGIPYAAVPTTLLAQVDASLGGKNGINFGNFKNILGTTRQPQFILFDYDLLSTLPQPEWRHAYAEIIKYGCILDGGLFELLEREGTSGIFPDPALVPQLVERCVMLKSVLVQQDEFEDGPRRLLNFGHTLGHALEKLYRIPHGQAVSLGMVGAAFFSRKLAGFPHESEKRLIRMLESYGLPVRMDFDTEKVLGQFSMDKKRQSDQIHFVLLREIGEAITFPLPLKELGPLLQELKAANH